MMVAAARPVIVNTAVGSTQAESHAVLDTNPVRRAPRRSSRMRWRWQLLDPTLSPQRANGFTLTLVEL